MKTDEEIKQKFLNTLEKSEDLCDRTEEGMRSEKGRYSSQKVEVTTQPAKSSPEFQESPRAEKSVEIQNGKETANGVEDWIATSSTASNGEAHPDSDKAEITTKEVKHEK